MTRARLFRIALPAALALAFVAVLTSVGGPADDASAAERAEVFVDHDALVPETPRRDLPVMLNPRDPANGRSNLATLTNDLIDGFLISGGNFQDARLPNGQIVRQPHLLIWDDLNNSLHCRGLIPDDEVLAVAAGPDAGTLIVAGRFNAITEPDGATVARRKIAKVDLDTCTVDTNWTVPSPNSKISELATINGRLFIGGNFTALGGNAIGHLAEVSLETGAVNPNFSFAVDGDQNRTMIVGMDVHPNGTRLGVIHKARTIDGADQRATAIFDISNPAAPTLTAHQVSQTSIPWRFHWLIQDGGFSPDFSRVIIANGTQVLEADRITLARSTEAPGQFEWEKNMWDTTFAIDISNNAVYAGGHFCRIEPGPGPTDPMAPNGLDRCTGVAFGGTAWRSQLAAFDLDDGTPLAWNPGSNAYKGIVSLKVVSRGLLIGQDGSRINSFNVGTTSFLDFGQNRDDLQPPEILTATAEQDAGGITVAGTVEDDIRARTVFVDVRSADGRWLQSNGTLATTPYRFSLTPSATGGFALSSPIPAGSFTISIDADDHAGRTAAAVQRTLTVAGDVPDAGTCVATIDGANVQLRWGAFNGEDDQYAVRDANGWVASVSANTTEWTGPNGTYTIRSREGGQTVEAPCTGAVDPGPDPDPGPQPDPSCRATPAGANVQLEWDAFNGEDDSYQVRSANGWLATVDADLPRVELVATPPLTILSREKGVSATLECTWDDGANADPQPIAINKPATQSSTWANVWVADWAIDGNTDGVFNNRSVASTQSNVEPWLQVELDGATNIDEIQIWNRTDCCPERLGSAHVFVSANDMTGRSVADLLADPNVTAYVLRPNPGTVETISTGGVTGTFVKVQLPRTDILTIAEVVLLG